MFDRGLSKLPKSTVHLNEECVEREEPQFTSNWEKY